MGELIRLPGEPTDDQLIAGVAQWLQMLSNGNYRDAVASIHFRPPTTAESLQDRIENFFGPEHSAKVRGATPEVLKRAEIYRDGIPRTCKAVVGFFVELENDLGIWTTFLVRSDGKQLEFEFEIFHL